MSDDVFEDEGPAHKNTHNLTTGVSTFSDYSPDVCRKAPDGKHDWNGPTVEDWDGRGGHSTCLHCGMGFDVFAMRCLP